MQSPILKAIVAFVVSLAGLVAQGVINGKPAAVIMFFIMVFTVLGVYVAPNTPQPARSE